MTRNADRSKVEYGQASQKKGKMSRGRKTSSQIRKQKRKKEATVSSKGKKEEKEKKTPCQKTDDTQTSMDESGKNSKLAAQ